MKLALLVIAGCSTTGLYSTSAQLTLCNEPEGAITSYTTAAEVNTLMSATWLHCSGPAFLSEDVGVAFNADFTYNLLGTDGDNITILHGFGNEGTWDSYQETTTEVVVAWHPQPNSGDGGDPQFESGPRRVAIRKSEAGEGSIYVALPH